MEEFYDIHVIPAVGALKHGRLVRRTGYKSKHNKLPEGYLALCHNTSWFNINGVEYWENAEVFFLSDNYIFDGMKYLKDDKIYTCIERRKDARHGEIIVHSINELDATVSFHFPNTCKKIVSCTIPGIGIPVIGKGTYFNVLTNYNRNKRIHMSEAMVSSRLYTADEVKELIQQYVDDDRQLSVDEFMDIKIGGI